MLHIHVVLDFARVYLQNMSVQKCVESVDRFIIRTKLKTNLLTNIVVKLANVCTHNNY